MDDQVFKSKIIIFIVIFIYFLLLQIYFSKLQNKNKKFGNYFNDINSILKYIYKSLNYRKQLENIRSLKKVVYTIILGNYDEPNSFKKQKGYDYYLITDNINDTINKATNWKPLKIPDTVQNLTVNTVKKQRFLKLHPHLLFKNYDLSIYLDGEFKIEGNLDEFLLRTLNSNSYLYSFEHPTRNNIIDEIKEVVRLKRDKKSMGELLYQRYKKEKFPDDKGLIESCLLIRKHNDKNCINIMEKWYEEIKKYSHRDQLSFNYIYWKNTIKIKYLSKQLFFQYFNLERTHLINKIYE
jgi:hypothetical protein